MEMKLTKHNTKNEKTKLFSFRKYSLKKDYLKNGGFTGTNTLNSPHLAKEKRGGFLSPPLLAAFS
jgi:hypothetical protein